VAPNQYTEEETVASHPSAPGEVLALTKAVQALVNALSNNKAGPTNATSQRAFIDALAALQNKPIINQEEHHLDIGLLSALNANEMAVLAVAKHRKFSPSDRTLLEDLGVKRSRLSQICNRLLKGGVLNVRATGRSRYYTMTSTAKAQLVAWGIEGGEA
jgi:DNA-binding MarR family transcriptional regulator